MKNSGALPPVPISDAEIARRRELLKLDAEELTLLAACAPLIEEELDRIVHEFYQVQTAIPENALLLQDAATLERLHAAQRRYVLELFSGGIPRDYVRERLRIGLVHQQRGVEPKLYLAAVSTLKGIIIKALERRLRDPFLMRRAAQALDRLFYFDVTLVFDAYICTLVEEVESARREAESYAQSLEAQVAERTRQLQELSERDPLSNLYNRRVLSESLKKELAHAKRFSMPLSLIYFDVDQFKRLNDINGHQFGDAVIRVLGELLLQQVREVDLPCRYGGDEFCIVLPDSDSCAAEVVCRKIIDAFKRSCPGITLSFGVAQTGPRSFVDAEELTRLADQRMYRAKARSGFRICR